MPGPSEIRMKSGRSMKRIVCSLLLLGSAAWLGAKQLVVLPDLHKPRRLVVGPERIYIGEFPKVTIFSRADFSRIKEFGAEGEGPREFKAFLSLYHAGDRLVVNSLGKISFFTREGKYIEEKTVNPRAASGVLPVGKDRFVARGMTAVEEQRYITANLLDGEMKSLKELGRLVFGPRKGRIQVLGQQMSYESDGESIYLLAGDTFSIEVFNREGEKTAVLKLDDYQRVRFTDENKKTILDEIRNNPRQKPYFDSIKDRLEFPEFWPAIFTVISRDGNLYVVTYRREKGRCEIITMDRKGRVIKKSMVPFRFRTAIQPYPTDIREGKLYQLVENEDEKWELQAWSLE